jgi:hypothetical protein
MFVERFHLKRLWSYKAIKEEIVILRKKLIRINDDIKGFKGIQKLKEKEADENNSLIEVE